MFQMSVSSLHGFMVNYCCPFGVGRKAWACDAWGFSFPRRVNPNHKIRERGGGGGGREGEITYIKVLISLLLCCYINIIINQSELYVQIVHSHV